MNRLVSFGATLLVLLSGSVTAHGQTCEVWDAPIPPGPAIPLIWDEFAGDLKVTFERHTGAPGNYTSTFRVEASVNGRTVLNAYRFLQLRIKETGVVYATFPVPESPDGMVSMNVGAGIQCKSATNPQRTVQLVSASDATDTAIWVDVIDEIVLRTPDPLGSIRIPDPTCFRSESGAPCTVDVEWESTHLVGQYQYLYVTVESPVWVGKIWRSVALDTPGSANSGNVKINKHGVTFRLIASNQVYSGSQYAALLAEGRELGRATAVSVPADGIVCPIDGQPMRRLDQEPTAFISVLANGLFGQSADPPAQFAAAANLLKQAGFKYVRRSIRWDKLESGQHTWAFYDNMFDAFAAAGLEPWITLMGMPDGFGDPELGDCDPNKPWSFPLAHGEEPRWAAFVAEAMARYGPGGRLGDNPCRNWEIWQEPDIGTMCGGFPEWRRLYDLAREEILSADPGARMWAPNLVIGSQRNPEEIELWLSQTLNSGLEFEGFALHCFTYHDDISMRLMYNGVRMIRERMDRAFPDRYVPLYVTATTHQHIGDMQSFRRELTRDEQEQFYLDLVSILANAGADAAMWFDATELSSTNTMLSKYLGPPGYYLPNPVYCGAERVAHWLLVGQ